MRQVPPKMAVFFWLIVRYARSYSSLLVKFSISAHFFCFTLSRHLLTSGFNLTEYITVSTVQIIRSPFWKKCKQASQMLWFYPRYTLSTTYFRRAVPVFTLRSLNEIVQVVCRRKRVELILNVDCRLIICQLWNSTVKRFGREAEQCLKETCHCYKFWPINIIDGKILYTRF